jgi:hypothetical protein
VWRLQPCSLNLCLLPNYRGQPGIAASVKSERADLAPLVFDMLNGALA